MVKSYLNLSVVGKKWLKATDMGDFYQVPADYRDLNYTKFIQEEAQKLDFDEYNSHNTNRLSIGRAKRTTLNFRLC